MDMTDLARHSNAIRTVIDAWYRAMEGADIAGLISLVTPDVIMKPPGAPAVVGRDALQDALSGFLETHSERVRYEIEEIEVCGELAFTRISESATISPRSGDPASSVKGMHLTILRRQADGRWLVARDISSLDEIL